MNWNKRRGGSNFSPYKDHIIIALLILGIILTIAMSGGSNRTYLLSNGTEVENPDLNQFCTAFVDQILHKNLHQEMVEPDIYEVLVQDSYKVLNLIGSERPLFSRANGDNCAVIIKDKIGLRRIEIWVNKSFSYPFYYRVQKVDEPLVES